MTKVVNDMRILKGMEKAGLIKLDGQTGTKITGLYSDKKFTCCYIDCAVGNSIFEYKGKKYQVKFVSGCFCPYVFEYEENKPEQKIICLEGSLVKWNH